MREWNIAWEKLYGFSRCIFDPYSAAEKAYQFNALNITASTASRVFGMPYSRSPYEYLEEVWMTFLLIKMLKTHC